MVAGRPSNVGRVEFMRKPPSLEHLGMRSSSHAQPPGLRAGEEMPAVLVPLPQALSHHLVMDCGADEPLRRFRFSSKVLPCLGVTVHILQGVLSCLN